MRKNIFTLTATLIFISSAFGRTLEVASTQEPFVGAIRWDAWTAGYVTEKTLSPKKHYDRLPWFAEVIDSSSVSFQRGSLPTVMDQEIQWAAESGIDYWAFFFQKENHPMNTGIDLYQKSRLRNRINFC